MWLWSAPWARCSRPSRRTTSRCAAAAAARRRPRRRRAAGPQSRQGGVRATSTAAANLLRPPSPNRRAQIAATMESLTATLGTKQKEADEFGAKHRITAQGQGTSAAAAAGEAEGAQGVLI